MSNSITSSAIPVKAAVMACMLTSLLACSSDEGQPAGLAAPHAPVGFSPTSATVRENERIARCNTVHSLTLPNAIVERYNVNAQDETGVISCSLQSSAAEPPTNLPAQVTGTVTTLTGRSAPVEFKEILDEGAVSYLGTFSIDAKSALDFEVQLTDPQSGQTIRVDLRQNELPGRR